MDRRSFLESAAATGSIGLFASCTLLASDSDNQSERSPATVSGTQSTPSLTPTVTPGTPGAGTEPDYRDEIEFDRVLNGVEDLGMDPTGREPIDEALDAVLSTGTLIELPPGRYLTTDRHTVEDIERWGIRGTGDTRASTRILPPEGAGLFFLNFRSGRDVLVQNLTFDVRPGHHEWMNNTFKLADGLRLQNIEYAGFYASEITGRKVKPTSIITGPLHVHVTEPDGIGRIDTLVRRGPTHHADYPNGTSCLFVGPDQTVGALELKNSHIENMSSHGIYASRTRGPVRVENTTFKNNNGAGCRISGSNSYVENCTFVLNADEAIPRTIGNRFNSMTTGMWFESGFRTRAGGRMTDCEVRMGRVPDRVRGIEIDGSVGRTKIENTSISLEGSVVRPIDINRPGQEGARVRTQGSVPPNPRVNLRSVSVSGPAPGPGGAIDLVGRPGSTIENCTVAISMRDSAINIEGADRYLLSGTDIRLTGTGTGVRVHNSTGGRIADTDIVAPAYPLVLRPESSPNACLVRITGRSTLRTHTERTGSIRGKREMAALGSSGCLDPTTTFEEGDALRVLAAGDGEAEFVTVATQ